MLPIFYMLAVATSALAISLTPRENPIHDDLVPTITPPPSFDPNDPVYVYFPQPYDWFTKGTMNVVNWQWAYDYTRSFRVVLSNNDTTLLATDIVLDPSVQSSMYGFSTTNPLYSANPGTGYFVSIFDAVNGTRYAKSEGFELKTNGATPTVPPPYSLPMTTETSGSGVKSASVGGVIGAAMLAVLLR